MLGPLVLVQWLALLAFALTVRHNGWLYYQGGDQTFYYTTSWLLSDWTMPTTPIGYGWSYLLSPIPLFSGTNLLAALPVLILFQTLVLLPVALACVYGIASRIGGRLFGYWAATLWVAVPYAAIPIWDQRFHQKYVEITLPQTLGLTGLADFPAMVCVLVAAYFVFRSLEARDPRLGALAGLAAGFAVAIKPANGLFLAAPLLAFLLARRWRQLLAFAVAVAPALVALAVWKQRGLGYTPVLAEPVYRLALGGASALPAASFLHPISRYVQVDFGMLERNLVTLREFGWSVRALEYLPFAGVLAIARRSLAKAGFVAFWFGAFLLFKGTSSAARVEDASFFRLLMPAFPAFFLLAVSIPLLIPTLGRLVSERFPPPSRTYGARNSVVGAALVIFALIPLVLVSAMPLQKGPKAVKYFDQGVFVPIAGDFEVRATAAGRAQRIAWDPPETGAVRAFYRVFRSPAVRPDPDPNNNPPLVAGVNCIGLAKGRGAAADCRVLMEVLGTTSSRNWVDRPPPGRWTYRVGLSANWLDDQSLGDVLLLSRSVTVTVGR